MSKREERLEQMVRELQKEVSNAFYQGCMTGRRHAESVGTFWIDASWKDSAQCRAVERVTRDLEEA